MPKKIARHKTIARRRHQQKVAALQGVAGDIRKYRLGKYDHDIDGYVHGLSLEGWGEELGDVQSFGHYCAIDLGRTALKSIEKDAKDEGDPLTTAEKNLIRGSSGAIISENDQGFVGVTYYKTKRSLDKAWAKIERDYEKHEEEYGESE